MKTPSLMNLINYSTSPLPVRRGLPLIALALTWFALSTTGRAQDASEADNNLNAAMEGTGALFSVTTGSHNTGLGWNALINDTTGNDNTASGFDALFSNTTGNNNVASGYEALSGNTNGFNNTATGFQALFSNTSAFNNVATGSAALSNNTTGNTNEASGAAALQANTTGNNNTADGGFALQNNTSGSNNIALGTSAGANLTTGSNNIDIGNKGKAGEANTIRIGTQGTQKATFIAGISGTAMSGTQVVVNSSGKLGIAGSSARFKEAIKPMDDVSEAVLKLKPVTFRYKEEIDSDKITQFGLVAEEVEKVNPDLVVRDEEGKVTTVRYEAVNAMLLNEFLKEHRKTEALEATVVKQQKQIEAMMAGLQKVKAEIELHSPATRTAAND